MERMTGYSWRRGCPGPKRSRCLKGTRGHSMAGRSQGRWGRDGAALRGAKQAPGGPLLRGGLLLGRGWRAHLHRCFLLRAVQLVVLVTVTSSCSAAGKVCSSTEPRAPSASLPAAFLPRTG